MLFIFPYSSNFSVTNKISICPHQPFNLSSFISPLTCRWHTIRITAASQWVLDKPYLILSSKIMLVILALYTNIGILVETCQVSRKKKKRNFVCSNPCYIDQIRENCFMFKTSHLRTWYIALPALKVNSLYF